MMPLAELRLVEGDQQKSSLAMKTRSLFYSTLAPAASNAAPGGQRTAHSDWSCGLLHGNSQSTRRVAIGLDSASPSRSWQMETCHLVATIETTAMAASRRQEKARQLTISLHLSSTQVNRTS
jgi:hypothetical protein